MAPPQCRPVGGLSPLRQDGLRAEARTIDYTRKQGLLHEEFVIPADAPDWLRFMVANRSVAGASEVFWNKVEDFEKRSDAQLAKTSPLHCRSN